MKSLITTLMALTTLLALLSATAVRAEDEVYSSEHLQQLLAPIALYPDAVLTHVLIAATYPIEVVQADRWVRKHPNLEGQDAVNAAENQDWDPSVKALLAFPDLLARMSEDLLWTQQVGEAFLASEEATLGAIQALRQQAWEHGTLKDMEHMQVIREEKHISIQPVRREVVYVPYYDSRVVYGHWSWSSYPPVYWSRPSHYSGGFYWGYHAPVGDWFYFSGFHWPRRTIVISHSRPYYYHSHRQYGYHEGARFWRHNPHHRRGVYYRNARVRQQWAQPDQQHVETRRYRTPESRREVTERLNHHSSRTEALSRQRDNNRTETIRQRSDDDIRERLRTPAGRETVTERKVHDNIRRDSVREALRNSDRSPRVRTESRTEDRTVTPRSSTRDLRSRMENRTPEVDTSRRVSPPQRLHRAPTPRVDRSSMQRSPSRSTGTRSAPQRER